MYSFVSNRMSEQNNVVTGRSRDPGARILGWEDYVFEQADEVASQYSDELKRKLKKGEFLGASEIVRQCVEEGLSTEEKKRKLGLLLSEQRLTIDMMENLWTHAGGDMGILKTMIDDEKVS